MLLLRSRTVLYGWDTVAEIDPILEWISECKGAGWTGSGDLGGSEDKEGGGGRRDEMAVGGGGGS